MVRKPNTAAAFCSECTSSKICEKWVATSPVPLFKRKRIIQFRATDEENLLEVVCSCPYYATYGIPCRHFVALLQVQPHHVHIRWHIDYAALFGRKGFENHLPLFEKRQFDARLKVTKAEKELMFINANKLWEELRSHSLEELFQAPLSQCFQKSATGIISHPLREITSPELGMVTQSQESVAASGLVTEEFDPGSSGDDDMGLSHTQAYVSGNVYSNCQASLEMVLGSLREHPTKLNAWLKAFHEMNNQVMLMLFKC